MTQRRAGRGQEQGRRSRGREGRQPRCARVHRQYVRYQRCPSPPTSWRWPASCRGCRPGSPAPGTCGEGGGEGGGKVVGGPGGWAHAGGAACTCLRRRWRGPPAAEVCTGGSAGRATQGRSKEGRPMLPPPWAANSQPASLESHGGGGQLVVCAGLGLDLRGGWVVGRGGERAEDSSRAPSRAAAGRRQAMLQQRLAVGAGPLAASGCHHRRQYLRRQYQRAAPLAATPALTAPLPHAPPHTHTHTHTHAHIYVNPP